MSEYIMDSGTDLGREQLTFLEGLLDGPTKQFVSSLCPRPGGRCLDVGAGNGSITRWLAQRHSSPERVSAVDLDDTHLDVPAGVTVHCYDVNDGVPTCDGFELVHTRLLLMHLKRRKEILTELADALVPGGWLVVGDFTFTGVHVLSAPSTADADLFRAVVEITINEVGAPAGIDYRWADTVDRVMADAGLVEVDTMTYHRTVRGGSNGMLLYGNYIRQVEPRLLTLGITPDELGRFYEVLHDPRMRVWLFPFVCTAGRRPGPPA